MRVVVLVLMLMIVLAIEKFRREVEDAVKVEGVAAEHGVERHRAIHGFVQLGVRVDRVDTRFDLANLVRANEIGLVEDDHIGEGNLVLGLRRVFQPLE